MPEPTPPTTRAEARAPSGGFLPLAVRRVFYVVGILAGAGAIIVGQYDPQLGANIAGAGALIVSSLALANPTR